MTTRRSKRRSSVTGEEGRGDTQESMSPPPPSPSGRGHVRTRSQSRIEYSQQDSPACTQDLTQCTDLGPPLSQTATKRRRRSPRASGTGVDPLLGGRGSEGAVDPLLNDSPSMAFMYSQGLQHSQPHIQDVAERTHNGGVEKSPKHKRLNAAAASGGPRGKRSRKASKGAKDEVPAQPSPRITPGENIISGPTSGNFEENMDASAISTKATIRSNVQFNKGGVTESKGRRVSGLFTTAKGGSVSVSEEAVSRAGQLLSAGSGTTVSKPHSGDVSSSSSVSAIGDDVVMGAGLVSRSKDAVLMQCADCMVGMVGGAVVTSGAAVQEDVRHTVSIFLSSQTGDHMAGASLLVADIALPLMFRERVFSMSNYASLSLAGPNGSGLTQRLSNILDLPEQRCSSLDVDTMRRGVVDMSTRLKLLHSVTSANASLLDFSDSADDTKFYFISSPWLGKPNDFKALKPPESTLLKCIFGQVSSTPLATPMKLWLAMQIRWIVWTLAGHERRSPHLYLGKLLTRSNVMLAAFRRYGSYVHGTVDARIAAMRPRIVGIDAELKNGRGGEILFPGTVRCPRFGLKRGSMSPLQRAVDIHVLRWPMVLCVAISGGKLRGGVHDSVHEGNAAESIISIEVTDGWWWNAAAVDNELKDFIRSGKLKDGCKIVVFGATFEESNSRTVIKLAVNGVRKATVAAPLGYVRPQYLSRGLSVRGLSASGGPVFAVSGYLILTSVEFDKIKVRIGRGRGTSSLGSSAGEESGDVRFYILTRTESEEYRYALAAKEAQYAGDHENDPRLTVRALLDGVRCDQWIKAFVLNHLSGGGYSDAMEDLSDSQRAMIARALEDLQRRRFDTMKKIVEEQTEIDSVMSDSIYHDVLVKCSTSGSLFWVRIPGEKAEPVLPGARKGKAAERVQYRVNNVKVLNGAPGGLPVLHATSSSRIVCAPAGSDVGGIDVGPTPLRDNAQLPVEVLQVQLWIVFWEIVNGDLLLIYCKSRDMVTVLFHYPLPFGNSLSKRLKWLVAGECIKVNSPLLKTYDNVNDIVIASRTEHTWVEVCKVNFDSSGTFNTVCNSVDNEKRRYSALQKGKLFFNLQTPYSVVRSCAHDFFRGVTLYVLDTEGATIATDTRDVSLLMRFGTVQRYCVCEESVFGSAMCAPDHQNQPETCVVADILVVCEASTSGRTPDFHEDCAGLVPAYFRILYICKMSVRERIDRALLSQQE